VTQKLSPAAIALVLELRGDQPTASDPALLGLLHWLIYTAGLSEATACVVMRRLYPEVRAAIVESAQAADAIIVSTDPLAAVMRGLAPRVPVFVVPNCIDLEFWEPAYQARIQAAGRPVTIGWMASGSHVVDAPLVRDALQKVMARHNDLRLHFIGWIGFEEMGMKEYADRIRVDPWIELSELPTAMQGFDIGICPLADNVFNRSKSGLKALQYWALGIPVLASDVPAYQGLVRDGENGFFCRTAEDWEARLEALVTDANLRRSMGEQGRNYARQQWDVRVRAEDWVKTYELIGG
jgi:glycosyltransferase involved in cell wall biosynthesis